MGMGTKDARFTENGGIRIGKDEVGKEVTNRKLSKYPSAHDDVVDPPFIFPGPLADSANVAYIIKAIV
jgi:hypothetical protein